MKKKLLLTILLEEDDEKIISIIIKYIDQVNTQEEAVLWALRTIQKKLLSNLEKILEKKSSDSQSVSYSDIKGIKPELGIEEEKPEDGDDIEDLFDNGGYGDLGL